MELTPYNFKAITRQSEPDTGHLYVFKNLLNVLNVFKKFLEHISRHSRPHIMLFNTSASHGRMGQKPYKDAFHSQRREEDVVLKDG